MTSSVCEILQLFIHTSNQLNYFTKKLLQWPFCSSPPASMTIFLCFFTPEIRCCISSFMTTLSHLEIGSCAMVCTLGGPSLVAKIFLTSHGLYSAEHLQTLRNLDKYQNLMARMVLLQINKLSVYAIQNSQRQIMHTTFQLLQILDQSRTLRFPSGWSMGFDDVSGIFYYMHLQTGWRRYPENWQIRPRDDNVRHPWFCLCCSWPLWNSPSWWFCRWCDEFT